MRQAIIMAAGEGQRLRPFTVNRPKVMLQVAGKPIIQYVIESLAACGVRDIVIVAGYRRQALFDSLGDGNRLGVSIRYVVQERQSGTAHALKQAEDAAGEEFLLLPGDNLIEPATIREMANAGGWTLLLKHVPEYRTVRYGVAAVENGFIKALVEKPREPSTGAVSTGIFSCRREIFDYLGDNNDLPSVINRMIGSGIEFKTVETDGAWLDIVYPWDLVELNEYALARIVPSTAGSIEPGVTLRGAVAIGEGSRVRTGCYCTGPILVGRGCELGPSVVFGPGVTIGDNVSIGPFSAITNSIIGDDVVIGPCAVIQSSVIASGCRIGPGFQAPNEQSEICFDKAVHEVNVGVLMGENCRLGNGVVIEPGAIIGNESSVKSRKVVSGMLPGGSLVV